MPSDVIPLTPTMESMDETNQLVEEHSKKSGFFKSCIEKLPCFKPKVYKDRVIGIGSYEGDKSTTDTYVRNAISNTKYNIITFFPLVLYEQFKLFLNLYFLVMAITQFIPVLRVGYLYTYWGPLGFVIFVTMCREAYDDFGRWMRDREANGQKYRRLSRSGVVPITSAKIKVGDLIYVDKDQRIPADMVLLRTTESNGTCFIRTDQLDGETDWKLRLAVPAAQTLDHDRDILELSAYVYSEKPKKDIQSYVGTFSVTGPDGRRDETLDLENTLWCSTVVASGTALGMVVYTGVETRSSMNTSKPRAKTGKLDLEVNNFSKVLFVGVFLLAVVFIAIKGFSGPWVVYLIRFILLFSSIIPLSMRVNLDLGKLVYSWFISHDKEMPGVAVRSTTIPEELGRIQILLTDKTGTLTQNHMVLKRLHLGTVSFNPDSMDEVSSLLRIAFSELEEKSNLSTKVLDAVTALALCHNVTPVYEDGQVSYQASSPDEVALVTWTEQVGLSLFARDLHSITLRDPSGEQIDYTILHIFPFTSDSKRMGIIVQNDSTDEITFYLKGADTVMISIVEYNDWLSEECDNLAREGLRTLVVAKKSLPKPAYEDFLARYQQARLSITDRNACVQAVVESLERDMKLLCVTGVEDKLQDGVRTTLEQLSNAGIKIWMLTGDKLETATCIAKSTGLVPRLSSIHIFKEVTTRVQAHAELNLLHRKTDSALIISGCSLQTCIEYYEHELMELACQCPSVVVCRCSPTQKAEIVRLLQIHTKKKTAAIGDGGNDVSMIQTADAGIGLVGKEGRQASLAADFSLEQFKDLSRLFLVHGRWSYKRSASLCLFVIHRGLIISILQAVFSSVFYLASVALFPGFLNVGYSTIFTMMPVFSLVLDRDVTADIALKYPELYKDLTKGRSLSYKIFCLWCLISVYQGSIIMYGTFLLFEAEFVHIVSISFSSLILTELIMILMSIRTWMWIMFVAEVISLVIYIISLLIWRNYFDFAFLETGTFIWKVLVITAVSCVPLFILKLLRRRFAPSSYSKLS